MKTQNSWARRWWVYQRERFPVAGHGVLILAFSSCAICFSALLRGAEGFPYWKSFVVAFVSSFISFFHLRVADEFKDFEEDAQFRPYRPVPRGLISLRELAIVGGVGGVVQLTLAVWLDIRVAPFLLFSWVYFGLMSREFFCRRWLKARPFVYMWSHMLIMPIIDFYATACDWMPAQGKITQGLFLFVAVSYLNGFVIEIGRKLRAPQDEEHGVETYSFLWGRKRAVGAWLTAMALAGVMAIITARRIDFVIPVVCVLGVVGVVSVAWGLRFLKSPKNGKPFEALSGIWTIALYVMLGIVPMLLKN